MTYDYTITEEEFNEKDALNLLKCSEGNCPHYDAFNQFCWLTWREKQEGDTCSCGLFLDGNSMIVKVLWNKKEKKP